MRFTTILLTGMLTCTTVAHAQATKIAEALGIGKTSALSNEKIASGLKEALQIGAGNAVTANSKVDGYFKNAAIKILMPEKLRTLEKGLRAAGQSKQVDEFVLAMNRAAEKSAPLARSIFLDAIKHMTFDDARKILSGNETAATEYFKSKTTARLTAAFTPVVKKATGEAGVTKQYKDLTARAQSIPFLRAQTLDVDQYVVGKALDGLFFMVADEEKKIRKNPAARVTSLLQDVFGRK